MTLVPSIKEAKAAVVAELNLDTRDPFTNLVAQTMALRDVVGAQRARIAGLEEKT